MLRANALAGLTDLDGALKEMQQALSLDPRSSLQTNLGLDPGRRGNRLEAEASYRQAVATVPKSVAAQVALGGFLWSAGKAADAEGAFQAALAIEPANELANRALAAYYEIGPRRRGGALLQESRGSVRHRGGEARACGLLHGTEAATMGVLEKLSAEARNWAVAREGSPTSSTPKGRRPTPSAPSTRW